MIAAVMVKFHDYEDSMEYVDTDKLDPNDFVDSELKKALDRGDKRCHIDASDWESHPEKFPDDDIGISTAAIIRKKPAKFDAAIRLVIDFDC